MINKKTPKKTGVVFAILLFSLCVKITNAQGPNAPEAASFEPVDATDMVNLITGDLSYVLPLLNVPSSEGGYPIALSYHAGIAMEQEASWVGLGWSLNPGTINRGVNGYPDDWGKTNVNEFFYDAGWTDDYYSFSAGITLGGGASVGLGLSWGSNQSLGGYVSASIGLGGKNGASIGASVGTNGTSIFGGVHGFNASIGTNGVGIGYGFSKKGSDTTLGVSLNHSYNSGLSGGISISQKNGEYTKGIDKGVGRYSSVGINFSSQGISANAKINGFGVGISTSSNGISGGDYDVSVSSSGFFIPAYIFYIGYNHTKVKYSLYKYNNLYTSGILNPIEANELRPYSNSTNLSRLLYENNFMDVNVFPEYNNSMEVHNLLENLNQVDKNNLVLPSYDNYSVTAQGLSGSLKPYIHSELNLSGRGRGEQNKDNIYAAYLNHNVAEYNSSSVTGINVNRDAVKKVNFTFDNAYNSFLRMERSNISEQPFLPSVHSDYIMKHFETNNTNNFYNTNSLTNEYEARKREGSHIETFTNKQIRDSYSGGVSNIFNFIDAKEQNSQNVEININRSDTKVFLDEGIGAYQITTSDGRTYHYSLPVYNFESFYKNFKNASNEDENFFEIQKTTPYATHWLLTAITGPDYIDVNSNGKLDEADYGYWVAFDYGKWSDGYVWQTPNGHFKVDENDEGDKTYSYAWGRKQIYYLDAIKTRTHTALFVKNLRDDNKSFEKQRTKQKVNYSQNESFSPLIHSKVLSSSKGILSKFFTVYAYDGDHFYDIARTEYYSRSTFDYLDIQSQKSMKLDKIILLKNESIPVGFNKNNSGLIIEQDGYQSKILYHSKFGFQRYRYLFGYDYTNAEYSDGQTIDIQIPGEYITPVNLKSFKSQLAKNILDVKDIEGLNLENKAQQIIELNHDYSLAKNSPNSTASGSGRLTLKEVNYKGKQGIQLVPPYKFSYYSSSAVYNKDNIDEWGYRKNGFDHIWSLNEIKTPTGGEIKIAYEENSYYAEAASYETKYFEDITLSVPPIPYNTIDIIFNNNNNNNNVNLEDYFKTGRDLMLSFTRSTWTNTGMSGYQKLNPIEFTTTLKLSSIVNNTFKLIPTSETEGITNNYVANMCNSSGSYCYENLKIKNNQYPLYTDADLNGKTGGGIRTKSITINNGVKDIAKSEYIYTNPTTNKISGITSYAPSDDPKGIPYVSELPPPMVTYEHVKMVNKDGNGTLLGSTAYQFGVLEPFHEEPGYIYSLGETFKVKENQNTTFQNGSIIANKYTLHNCLGNVGRMLSIKSYNAKGQLLNESVNNYKTDLDTDGEIGVTQESHKSYKRIMKDNVESFAVSSTSKVNYPSVLESTTITQGGFKKTTYFNKHDFLTGQVLETTTTDSKDNEFKSELIPAYTKYGSGSYSMGSKVDNPTNKNMLTQEAITKTYIKVGGNWEETGVGITTWNNYWAYTNNNVATTTETTANKKIWRKHKSYIWDGELNLDGTYNGFIGDDDNFDWTVGPDIVQSNSDWKNTSTTTQYDHYSMPLEVKDINDNYSSTKMCDNNSKVLAVSNAAYTEMYYSGAETVVKDNNGNDTNYFDGQVKSFGRQLDTNAHTGNYSIYVGSGQKGFEVKLPANPERVGDKSKFKISIWVSGGEEHKARITVGTTTFNFESAETVKAGNWTQLNGYITIPSSETTVAVTSTGSPIHLDDFRLHPVASSMTSYVYNEWDELTFLIGTNNLATCFVYDATGRLKETWIEVKDQDNLIGGFKKVSENSYNYKAQ